MPNYTEEAPDYKPEEVRNDGRDAKGRLMKGHTANPNGRPKKGSLQLSSLEAIQRH